MHLQSVEYLLLNKWWNEILCQSQLLTLRNTKKVQDFYNYTVYACICLCIYVVAFICKHRMIFCAYVVYQVRILVHKKCLSHYRLILCRRMKRANSSDYTETYTYALEYTLMLKIHIHGFTHIELHWLIRFDRFCGPIC